MMLLQADEVESHPSIDLTPIIDMVFLLLIFFLVATTFHQEEREMQIALPEARAAGPISANLREIVINVDRDGRIILGGQAVEPEELRRMVTQRVEVNPEQKVAVRGDRGTVYANVVRVLDICKAAGIQEPYLDTVLEE
ncbi:MAG: biopolymer transporter ExbD [Phycisphaerae bacterium]|jgi:biopolymer transport protein ExbD